MKSKGRAPAQQSEDTSHVVKKKKKAKDKIATVTPVKMTPTDQQKNKPSGNSDYSVGQIAALLCAKKEPTSGNEQSKGRLSTMFGSVGSTGGLTCPTRALFAPLATSGREKKTLENQKKVQKHESKETVLNERKQQQQEQPESTDGAQTTDKHDKTTRKERPKPSPEETRRTVFVGNLPLVFDKKKLRKLFHKFGEIKSIRFRSVAPSDPDLPKRVIAHTKQFHPERDSMNSYVVFSTEEAAQKALKRNGKEIGKNHIRVDLASNNRKHNTKHSVFLGNLPFNVSDDIIRQHFEECGQVDNVRVIRDAKTGLGKGFGYLLFAEDVSVEFALKLDGSRMAGRNIRVQRATKQKQRAMNAMKRLQMKQVPKTKGGKLDRGQGKPGRGTTRTRDQQVAGHKGNLHSRQPRKTKSGQMRSKSKGHQAAKGKPSIRPKKHGKPPKGKRKSK